MVMVLQRCVEGLHAWREVTPGIEVKVPQVDLVFTCWGCWLKQVKVNGIVVGQPNQHALEPLILEDHGQELAGLVQLLGQLGLEVGRSDAGHLVKVDVGGSLAEEDLALANKT